MYRLFMGVGLASVGLTIGFDAFTDRLRNKKRSIVQQPELEGLPEVERKLQQVRYIPGEAAAEEDTPRGVSLKRLEEIGGSKEIRLRPLVEKKDTPQEKGGYI